MIGALGAVMSGVRRRPFARGGMAQRRRFADGGGVGSTQVPTPDDPSAPTTEGGPPGGAMSAVTPGALSPQDKVALGQQAMSNMMARQSQNILAAGSVGGSPLLNGMTGQGGGSSQFSQTNISDPASAPDATNLPMLAAAGAMLKPTHSGSFSEALGNAFDAAVPVAEKQREMNEQAQLRAAQIDANKAIWGAKIPIMQQRADAYTQFAGAHAAELQSLKTKYDTQSSNGGFRSDWKYVGNNPDGSSQWVDSSTGQIKDGPTIGLTTNQAATNTYRDSSLVLRRQAMDALAKQRGIQNDQKAMEDLAKEVHNFSDAQVRLIISGQATGKVVTPGQAAQTVQQTQSAAQRAAALPLPAEKSGLQNGKLYDTGHGVGVYNSKTDSFDLPGQQ